MTEYDEREMARVGVMACAYNAAVNFGSERGRRKMWDLIRAINHYERVEGEAKMEELLKLGIIEGYVHCPPECCVRPGGLFHAKGCTNESNSDFIRGIWEKTRQELPEPKRARYISIGLVGNVHDHRLDSILPVLQAPGHRHTDPIGNPIDCAAAGCDGPES